MLTFGSLFAGIGGMDLGLERAGMQCKWQVEIDPYAQKVLRKNFAGSRVLADVRETHARTTCGGCTGCVDSVDVICGGFPCQDISNAGKRIGIGGSRSGLWSEFARLIRELRPRYVLVENVAALLVRGLDVVCGDLAASGYDAEWDCLPASLFGAPHRRDRLFLVAYPVRAGLEGPRLSVLDSKPPRGELWRVRLSESDALRSRDGVPGYVDRIRGLGNAVVPQVAEFIGRRIIAHAEAA